jgi:D-amino-acid dehydrogenase
MKVHVIGGGVIGVCAAYSLAEAGQEVVLVEKGDLAAGCSYGNAGLVTPSHSIPLAAPGALRSGLKWLLDPESPFYVRPRPDPALIAWLARFILASRQQPMLAGLAVLSRLSLASRALFDELTTREGLEFGFQGRGLLLVFHSRPGLEAGREEAHLLQGYGLASQVLDGEALRAMEPSLRPDMVGGVYFPNDAHLDPAAFVRGLGGWLAGRGVRILTGVEVVGFETSGGRVQRVQTTRGDLEAEQIILAAGSWSPGLARALKLRLPIQPAKGYTLTVRRPALGPAYPLILGEARMAVTPLGERLRFGGTLELAGFDESINRRRVAALERGLRRYLVGMEGLEVIELWRGLRPCTPDGLPILGRAPGLGNLIIAAGHAMLGMSLGPVTGKLAAQLIGGQTPDFDLSPLSPSRFA